MTRSAGSGCTTTTPATFPPNRLAANESYRANGISSTPLILAGLRTVVGFEPGDDLRRLAFGFDDRGEDLGEVTSACRQGQSPIERHAACGEHRKPECHRERALRIGDQRVAQPRSACECALFLAALRAQPGNPCAQSA